jgi:RNA polymerase sigma-70 factor (ECF subfamily)
LLGASLDGNGLPAFEIRDLGRLFEDDEDGGPGTNLGAVAVLVSAGIVLKIRTNNAPVDVPQVADPLRALMDKIKLGDQAAFRELHRACAQRVHAFVQRIVKRHELADEVASNVFMQVWRDAVRFDSGRGCTFAWISAIARSRSLDMLRQVATRQRHEEPLDEVDSDNTADTVAGPHELLQSVRLRKVLGAGLARLTPAQRHVLRLTFFEGLSHEEVAATASLPLGTVKSHARRGLAALRENLSIAAMAA